MALERPLKLIPKVLRDKFGKGETVDQYIKRIMNETQKELLPQAHFVTSLGWTAICEKYQVLIKNEEEKIVYLSSDTDKNKHEIQRASDLLRSMVLFLSITDGVIETFQRNQNKEGEAKKTEPTESVG